MHVQRVPQHRVDDTAMTCNQHRAAFVVAHSALKCFYDSILKLSHGLATWENIGVKVVPFRHTETFNEFRIRHAITIGAWVVLTPS